MNPHQPLVGIDWGTTHRRGYLLVGGQVRAEADDAQGALASRGRFPAALDEMLAALGTEAQNAPVVMSGMVGSAFGWREAPYLDTAVPLAELQSHLVRLEDAGPGGATRSIVPGYADIDGDHVDVMRGEEMQLLGAVALGHRDGWFVLPGTHGKWVRLRGGRIERLITFMTGELYASLMAAGTLASAAAGAEGNDAQAFIDGLDAAERGAVPHALFGARARVATKRMPASHVAPYVSGVLVGAEWQHMRGHWGADAPQHVTLIGAPALRTLHEHAAQRASVRCTTIDPRDVYLAALGHLAGAAELRT